MSAYRYTDGVETDRDRAAVAHLSGAGGRAAFQFRGYDLDGAGNPDALRAASAAHQARAAEALARERAAKGRAVFNLLDRDNSGAALSSLNACIGPSVALFSPFSRCF